MPSVLTSKMDQLWSNPPSHPLGLSTKDPAVVSCSGASFWDMERTESGLQHDETLDHFRDLSMAVSSGTPSSRGRDSSSCTAIGVRNPRNTRPTARSDSQKVIEVRNRIFVGGLTEAINEDDLRALFGRYGEVTEVAIKARGGDQFRGFGFITFNKNCEAADCLRDCAGEFHTLRDRKINVCAAFKRVDKVVTGSAPFGAGAGQRRHGMVAPPVLSTPLPSPGWMGPISPPPPPTPAQMSQLPVLFNPFYYGPPVISNGMWYCGPASSPGLPLGGPMPYPMCGGGGGFGGGIPFPPADSSSIFGLDFGMHSAGAEGSTGTGAFSSKRAVDSHKESGFQPIGTKNAATVAGADSSSGHYGGFTTLPLTAPWFLPN